MRGIWPAVLVETGMNGRLDLRCLAAVCRRFARAQVHGLYTADTASEFYSMEFEEWNELVTEFRGITRELGVTAGAGCTWTNQAGALRRVERAAELDFDNIHLSQPYWLKLNAPAQREFWRAVNERAGRLKIVVYAGSQGQFPLDGSVVGRLREYCPAIAGTKSPGFDALATNSMLARCPELAHFVGESVLAGWVALGAAGCPSSLAGLSPEFMVRWFQQMERGEWAQAFEIQQRVIRFYESGVVPARALGYVVDKALAELGGIPGISRKVRAPYTPLPDDLFAGLEAAARRYLPECFSGH